MRALLHEAKARLGKGNGDDAVLGQRGVHAFFAADAQQGLSLFLGAVKVLELSTLQGAGIRNHHNDVEGD